MCFALGLCILLIPLNQKHNWVGFFYRHEVEIPQEKAGLCHFWYVFGKHQQNHFYLEVFGYSHSFPAMAILAVDTKSLSFGLKALWVVLFSSPCLAQLFCRWQEKDVIWRQQLEGWEVGQGGCGELLSCLRRDPLKWTVQWKEMKEKGNSLPGNLLGGINLHGEWLTNW